MLDGRPEKVDAVVDVGEIDEVLGVGFADQVFLSFLSGSPSCNMNGVLLLPRFWSTQSSFGDRVNEQLKGKSQPTKFMLEKATGSSAVGDTSFPQASGMGVSYRKGV